MNPNVLAIIIFLGIALAVAWLLMALRDLRARREALLEGRLNGLPGIPQRPGRPLSLNGNGTNGGSNGWFNQLLIEAGVEVAAKAALLFSLLAGLLLGGVLFLWRNDVLAGAVGFLVGVLVVLSVLLVLRTRRRRAILQQLPDVMGTLGRAMRAGESIDQAIHTVSHWERGPLARELRRCARQLEMGLSLDAAMRLLTRRVPLMEMRILAATLMVQRQTGGNLPLTLERLSTVFRDRLNFQRQHRAATATSRGGAMLIACVAIFAAVYTLVGRPDYVQEALAEPVGRLMLTVALVLIAVGISWCAWLLRTDY